MNLIAASFECLQDQNSHLHRPETEAYTGHLASLLLENPELTGPKISSLRILDLCTGTGCIALSLYALLSSKRPELEIIIRGVDISQIALDLAKANLAHNVNSGNLDVTATDRISFVKGDMLSGSSALSSSAISLPGLASDTQSHWDILISNPPYISSSGFATSTARSVRNFEPKLALVPATSSKAASDSNLQSNDLQQNPEDIFYPRILSTACKTQAKLVLMEVADMVQAVRVVELAVGMGIWRAVEIWRDWPYQDQNEGEIEKNYVDINVNNKFEKILVRGVGEGRAVVCKL